MRRELPSAGAALRAPRSVSLAVSLRLFLNRCSISWDASHAPPGSPHQPPGTLSCSRLLGRLTRASWDAAHASSDASHAPPGTLLLTPPWDAAHRTPPGTPHTRLLGRRSRILGRLTRASWDASHAPPGTLLTHPRTPHTRLLGRRSRILGRLTRASASWDASPGTRLLTHASWSRSCGLISCGLTSCGLTSCGRWRGRSHGGGGRRPGARGARLPACRSCTLRRPAATSRPREQRAAGRS